MQIRAAQMEDVEVLSKIHHVCFARGWSVAELQSFLLRPDVYLTLVACPETEQKNFVSSFILVSHIDNEAEILTICVDPFFRRKGLAKTLFTRALDQLKAENISNIYLEVSTGNAPAIGFYKSIGFEMNGKRSAYSKQADGTYSDAYMMKYSFVS